MTAEEHLHTIKREIIGDEPIITSIADADLLHDKFIELRKELFTNRLAEVMPHYRGEQKYGWDIHSGIFRPPLNIKEADIAKQLEEKAIKEFEEVIHDKIGKNALRDIFNQRKYGKEWDLLFQSQHAGIRTTLTDWTAFILSAVFFATEESGILDIDNADGQVWCFFIPTENILADTKDNEPKSFYDKNPFDLKGTYIINPSTYLTDIEQRLFEYRMYRQKGRFVFSGIDTCNIPVNQREGVEQFLVRIRIPAEAKVKIRQQLSDMKVTREHLYVEEKPEHQELIVSLNKRIFA